MLALAGCNRDGIPETVPDASSQTDLAIGDLAAPSPDLIETCPIFSINDIPISSIELMASHEPIANTTLRLRFHLTVLDGCVFAPRFKYLSWADEQGTWTASIWLNAWTRSDACGQPRDEAIIFSTHIKDAGRQFEVKDGSSGGFAALSVDLLPAVNVDCAVKVHDGDPCQDDCQCADHPGSACVDGSHGTVCALPCQRDSECSGEIPRCSANADPAFTCVPLTDGCTCDHSCPFDSQCQAASVYRRRAATYAMGVIPEAFQSTRADRRARCASNPA
jgi:hypothetical protein